jgi:hypothetical protein
VEGQAVEGQAVEGQAVVVETEEKGATKNEPIGLTKYKNVKHGIFLFHKKMHQDMLTCLKR